MIHNDAYFLNYPNEGFGLWFCDTVYSPPCTAAYEILIGLISSTEIIRTTSTATIMTTIIRTLLPSLLQWLSLLFLLTVLVGTEMIFLFANHLVPCFFWITRCLSPIVHHGDEHDNPSDILINFPPSIHPSKGVYCVPFRCKGTSSDEEVVPHSSTVADDGSYSSRGDDRIKSLSLYACCSICLCKYRHGEPVIGSLVCSHIFHPQCLLLWIGQQKSTCPNCRQDWFPVKNQ